MVSTQIQQGHMVHFMRGLSKYSAVSGINYNATHVLLSRVVDSIYFLVSSGTNILELAS